MRGPNPLKSDVLCCLPRHARQGFARFNVRNNNEATLRSRLRRPARRVRLRARRPRVLSRRAWRHALQDRARQPHVGTEHRALEPDDEPRCDRSRPGAARRAAARHDHRIDHRHRQRGPRTPGPFRAGRIGREAGHEHCADLAGGRQRGTHVRRLEIEGHRHREFAGHAGRRGRAGCRRLCR
ncbi:hypothetical protein F01_140242 [Burkholderia cenocepacia]|nr:hypothetical protein F01_140242 [Burkholderia cenocepacia]